MSQNMAPLVGDQRHIVLEGARGVWEVVGHLIREGKTADELAEIAALNVEWMTTELTRVGR